MITKDQIKTELFEDVRIIKSENEIEEIVFVLNSKLDLTFRMRFDGIRVNSFVNIDQFDEIIRVRKELLKWKE